MGLLQEEIPAKALRVFLNCNSKVSASVCLAGIRTDYMHGGTKAPIKNFKNTIFNRKLKKGSLFIGN